MAHPGGLQAHTREDRGTDGQQDSAEVPSRELLRKEYTELEDRHNRLLLEVDGRNGLRARAARYDMMTHSFMNILTLAASEQNSAAFQYPAPRFPHQLASSAISSPDSNPEPAPIMPSSNSGVLRREAIDHHLEFRADEVSGTVQDAGNSDSHEGPHPVAQPRPGEDANITTLGNPQNDNQDKAATTSSKRPSDEDIHSYIESLKRSRPDPNRVSALAQENRMPRFSTSPPRDASLHAEIRSAPARLSEVNLDPYRSLPPLGRQFAAIADSNAAQTPAILGHRFVHSFALYVGPAVHFSAWDTVDPKWLKGHEMIPNNLLDFLLISLGKHITSIHIREYNAMPPNGNVCIARYVAERVRTAGGASERRAACESCISAARPCAMLQDLRGIRTIVVLPLRDHMRVGKKWTDEEYWVMVAK